MNIKPTLITSLLLAFTACGTVGDDYVKPRLEAESMATWNGRLDGAVSAAELDPAMLASWWTSFEDATLDSLIERATQANLDLRTARAQLRAARAQRLLTEGARAPSVNASAADTRSGNAMGSGDSYSTGLDASWELDLFGGQERGSEAADADLQAAQEARRDVLVSVLAEVALSYAELRTMQRRHELTQENLSSMEEHREIVRAQLDAGLASQLDIDRVIANVEKTRAALPSLTQQINQDQNRLAVLCGLAPGALDAELAEWKPLTLPDMAVAVGVPAEVLRRRPDVRRAERLLAAETARVGVAKADLYPKFSLGGSIGLESDSTSSLFDAASRLWNFGPRLQWNLFDGGRARQRIEIQNAVQEQAMIAYEAVILNSLEEVQNAVTAFGLEQIRHASLQTASESAARAAELAQTRFTAGGTSFLDVLDAQRTRLGAIDEQTQSQGQIIANLIRLYKALGGGWNPNQPNAPSQPE